ncbi:hypothetical protein Val02_51770 [Virgisporangium aliadipatigenens]|uniref:Hsp70 family protein n=1 Tax=Virgisporangium aliadipatigenens TaxID=741659 RepID=A0A8J3YR08_9ACTN|nr:Hsp70 family protein [Virgisporangium aliadipatigenens]GIJ48291.1 hypothetical protein Val02_51770 [Virgisporangium aliadipatigenens]
MGRHSHPSVGLDFGTTTALIARRRAADPVEILPIGNPRSWLPSLVGRRDGRLVVGENAENLLPEEILRSVKRAITFDQRTLPLGAGDDRIEVSREDVIAAILHEISTRAGARGLPLTGQRDLRVGCPATWRRDQRQLLTDLVVAQTGVDDVNLMEEPVAAGLAWIAGGDVRPEEINGRVLVFDMGGGTLDVAVLDVVGGRPPSVRVLTSTGIPEAGDALDDAIAADLTTELVACGLDLDRLRKPDNAHAEILRQARAVKRDLSVKDSAPIAFRRAAFGSQRVTPIRYTRERLEEAFAPQLERAATKVWDALRLARLTHVRGGSTSDIMRTPTDELARDVRYVVLAGGMSRIPVVRRRLREMLPDAEFFDGAGVPADEAVVAGLTDESGVDAVNLYRPSFDVTLHWGDDGALPLFEAYSPLFEMFQLTRMSEPNFTRVAGRRDGLPQQRQGELRVTTPAGDPVDVIRFDRSGGQAVLDRVPVPFGFHDVLFRMYCDGRIVLTDGAGHSQQLRVGPWPAIHGRNSKPEQVAHVPEPRVYHPFNRS